VVFDQGSPAGHPHVVDRQHDDTGEPEGLVDPAAVHDRPQAEAVGGGVAGGGLLEEKELGLRVLFAVPVLPDGHGVFTAEDRFIDRHHLLVLAGKVLAAQDAGQPPLQLGCLVEGLLVAGGRDPFRPARGSAGGGQPPHGTPRGPCSKSDSV
jgi:hypothetical protein